MPSKPGEQGSCFSSWMCHQSASDLSQAAATGATGPLMPAVVFDQSFYLEEFLRSLVYVSLPVIAMHDIYELGKMTYHFTKTGSLERNKMLQERGVLGTPLKFFSHLIATGAIVLSFTLKSLAYCVPPLFIASTACGIVSDGVALYNEFTKQGSEPVDQAKVRDLAISAVTKGVLIAGVALLLMSNPFTATATAAIAIAVGVFFVGIAIHNTWRKYQQIKQQRMHSTSIALFNKQHAQEGQKVEPREEEKAHPPNDDDSLEWRALLQHGA